MNVQEWQGREAHGCICRCGKSYVSQTRYHSLSGCLQLESREACHKCGLRSPLAAGGIPEHAPAAAVA